MPEAKLSGPADLQRFREEAQAAEARYRARVLVCMTGCRSLGAIQVGQAFRDKVAAAGLQDEVAVVTGSAPWPRSLSSSLRTTSMAASSLTTLMRSLRPRCAAGSRLSGSARTWARSGL
jgi:hypothetical protein